MEREEIAAYEIDKFEFEVSAILPNSTCDTLGDMCDNCQNDVQGYANKNKVIFLPTGILDVGPTELISVKNIRTGKTENARVLEIRIKPGGNFTELCFINQKLAASINAQPGDKIKLKKIE